MASHLSTAALDHLESGLKKLRAAYEKYFLGVERIEPIKERQALRAALRRAHKKLNPNTAYKYKLQQIQASLITHESYWNRVCRQIEEGQYRRRNVVKRGSKNSDSSIARVHPELGEQPSSIAPPQTGIEQLHQEFVRQQEMVGDTRNINAGMLRVQLEEQRAKLKKQLGCRDCTFRVVTRDGKAVLVAKPVA